MFATILKRSLSKRKSRVAVAVLAVVMGASIASGLLTTSMSVTERIGKEFRQFGANIVVLPKSETIEVGLPGISFGTVTEQHYISESDLWRMKKLTNWSANILGYAPFLYTVVEAGNGIDTKSVVLAGTYFTHPEPRIQNADGTPWVTGIRSIMTYWELRGEWVTDENDTTGSIMGTVAASKLGLVVGSTYSISYTDPTTGNATNRTLAVKGIVSTGGTEDSQIFVNLALSQNISNRPGKVHSVQLSALCVNCPAEKIAREIEYSLPGVDAKSVKQLVLAEEKIMMQVEQMMLLVTIVSLAASALGVMTTMTTTVIERRKEIGLMKAIGADNSKIAALFLGEAALIGILGAFLGYAVGFVLAQFIGRSVFGSAVDFIPVVIPITLGLSIAVVLLSSALPVRRALKIEPAIVLRGE